MSKTVEFMLKIPTAEGRFIRDKMAREYHGTYTVELQVHDDVRKPLKLTISDKPATLSAALADKVKIAILQELHTARCIDKTATPKCGSDAEQISAAIAKVITGKIVGASQKLVETAEVKPVVTKKATIAHSSESVLDYDDTPIDELSDTKIGSAEIGAPEKKFTDVIKSAAPIQPRVTWEQYIRPSVTKKINEHFLKKGAPRYPEKNYGDMITLASDLINDYANGEIRGQFLKDKLLEDCPKSGGFPKHSSDEHIAFANDIYIKAKQVKAKKVEQDAAREITQ